MPLMPLFPAQLGYQPQSVDTSINTDILMFNLLRTLTPPAKAQRLINFQLQMRSLVLNVIKNLYPDATFSQIRQEFSQRIWGDRIDHDHYQQGEDIMLIDPLSLAKKVADILDSLEIPYLIGGSVASSLWGENRVTQDLDLVVNIDQAQAGRLIEIMSTDFYISEEAVLEAISQRSSFNIIYLLGMEKVDIFLIGDDPFSQSKMSRRCWYNYDPQDATQGLYFYTPEDIILQKLRWYKMAFSESQKQWRDVLGVLKLQGERLDFPYLEQWSEYLNLTDLLMLAKQQSGL